MSAAASSLGRREYARTLRVVNADQSENGDSASTVAPITLSLSLMREAFDGLGRNAERSLSLSVEQRGELKHSEEVAVRPDRAPSAFKEESYSFHAVEESGTDISSTAFECQGATNALAPRGPSSPVSPRSDSDGGQSS
jgi:hypothetical protein